MGIETSFLSGKGLSPLWRPFMAAGMVVCMAFGGFQAAVSMPSRLNEHDRAIAGIDARIDKLDTYTQADHDILIRIEAQLREMRDEMHKPNDGGRL